MKKAKTRIAHMGLTLLTFAALTVGQTARAVGDAWNPAFDQKAGDEKQMCVIIHETQRTTAFALEDRPVVSFTETDVKLECKDVTVLYSLDNYLKMTIEETSVPTEVKALADESFRISGSNIIATGCTSLSLYTVDGKCLATGRAAADGIITLPVGQFQAGTYIVVFGNQSFKIYIRK